MDQFDVVIVGGGPAGLSAALALGRARRTALLLDSNEPRNTVTDAAHNFVTRDGAHPLELRRIGGDQLAPYVTIDVADGSVDHAEGMNGGFHLRLAGGREIEARKLILATGVQDVLPEIEGLREIWGTSAFVCPYCDGWEVRDQPWAVLVPPPALSLMAVFLQTWTRDLVMLTNGIEVDDALRNSLAALGVSLRTEPIARFEHGGSDLQRIVFGSGAAIERSALLLRPQLVPRTALAEQLGCELIPDGPIPGLIQVDQMFQTSVRGVFAVGDVVTPMQSIAQAVSSGHVASAAANHDFALEMLALAGAE